MQVGSQLSWIIESGSVAVLCLNDICDIFLYVFIYMYFYSFQKLVCVAPRVLVQADVRKHSRFAYESNGYLSSKIIYLALASTEVRCNWLQTYSWMLLSSAGFPYQLRHEVNTGPAL